MAKSKRMINCNFVNASSFKLKTSNKAKLLYFYIITNADDKGFCDSVDEICELLNFNDKNFCNIINDTSKNDYIIALNELIDKNLLFKIQDNHNNFIYLIRHWYLHNLIPEKRTNDSSYEKYLSLYFVNDNKEYQLKDKNDIKLSNESQMYDKCNANDNHLSAQIKLNEIKLNKSKLNEININNINNKNNNNNNDSLNYLCNDEDSDEEDSYDENEYYKIPKEWDMNNVSKATYLFVKKRNGETLSDIQECYLQDYLSKRTQ